MRRVVLVRPLVKRGPVGDEILPIADLRTRMVMAGHSKAEIASAIKAAFDNKCLPDLENGAMAFSPARDPRHVGLPVLSIKDATTTVQH